MYWHDWNGNPYGPYYTLAPKQSSPLQGTFVTHCWGAQPLNNSDSKFLTNDEEVFAGEQQHDGTIVRITKAQKEGPREDGSFDADFINTTEEYVQIVKHENGSDTHMDVVFPNQ